MTGVKATLNNSLAHRAPLIWAVCIVANPRDSYGYRCGLRLASIPNQGARHCGGLFSVDVGSNLAPGYVFVDWRAQVMPDAH